MLQAGLPADDARPGCGTARCRLHRRRLPHLLGGSRRPARDRRADAGPAAVSVQRNLALLGSRPAHRYQPGARLPAPVAARLAAASRGIPGARDARARPPCTLITEVNVRQGPTALQARPVALSALNIIIGPNSTGKSTLLNLLARAGHGDSLAHRPWEGHLAADIHWFDPQPHLLQFHDRNGDVEVLHDDRHIPLRPAPYRAVTMRPTRHPGAGLDHWAGLLGLDRGVFLMVLQELPRCVRGEVTQVDVTSDAPVVRLRSLPDPVRLDTEAPLGIAGLVLFEATIALAQMHSQKAPVLLLIDDFGDFLHPALVRRLFTTLTGASRGFQTIVATHYTLPPEVRQEWTITPIGEDDCEHHIGAPLRNRSLATWANDIGC